MEDLPPIRSPANSLLKRVGAVLAGKQRDGIVLEGERLIDDALEAGWKLEVILVEEEREPLATKWEAQDVSLRRVEGRLLARASGLETSPGCLALASRPPEGFLGELGPRAAPRILVVAGLQDPGNLGALARSAEGAGFAHLVVVAGGARPFGPKALRGSMGSLLRLRVCRAEDASQAARHLGGVGYRQVCAATRGGAHWRDFDWSPPLALWVGGEAGIDAEVMGGFERVSIPMAGRLESLNVTVAASLLLFRAGEGL